MSRSNDSEHFSSNSFALGLLISYPCRSYSSILQCGTTTCLDFPWVSLQCFFATSLFRLPNPCYETLQVQSILICRDNTFDSVFTSCCSLDCFPTNSSITFITGPKHIPHAVRWMVHRFVQDTGFLRTEQILLYQPWQLSVGHCRPAGTKIDKADSSALKTGTRIVVAALISPTSWSV